ncbi:MAG: 2-oxoglutarate dehydrogenase complex dihydrolipoyllysine-residue succinyltransferase [Phycisphaerales bacterium]|nr:2-oxoglutarate dehydrogenase complex dihydrolipoyllysine-residue succinyltransferase [Phycisphaerales bacterium]
MANNIVIPSLGESIVEVTVGRWLKSNGDFVQQDEMLVEIESDKVTQELPAASSGQLSISVPEGTEMKVGDTIGSIDSAAQPTATPPVEELPPTVAPTSEPAAVVEQATAAVPAPPAQPAAAPPAAQPAEATFARRTDPVPTPLARKVAEASGVSLAEVHGTGPSGRITKADVMAAETRQPPVVAAPVQPVPQQAPASDAPLVANATRGARRERMSKLRQRVAERLVSAQQTTAMLTTFNEIDMSQVMRLRSEHKDSFIERYGVKLGFMSFFCKACVSALQAYPRVNAYIVGQEIEYHDYADLSVAVGTDKGLVVPIIRNAETMDFAELEMSIANMAARAREGKLTVEDMTGGTFTISNGGVYGSLMSTPILNPPQSGILGLHKIMKRPVEDTTADSGVALKPMMYVALSYDHRMIDGAEAVGFLIHIKNCIENPERMLLGL